MAAHINDDEPQDTRELIWLEYDKFAPENHKVSAFITSKFTLQTCVEGVCWKTVTSEQRQWHWDEFVKKYKWDKKDESEIRQVWYKNTADLYCQTIHRWRQKRKHPETVTEAQWAKWTDVWDSEDWKAMASKYWENKNAEPVRPGTGTTKHITGLKCYALHVQTLEQMKAYLEEALTPFEDETMPDAPLPQEIDRQFLIITSGPRKVKLYGLSTIASTIYPQVVTPRPRGSSSLGQSIYASREKTSESREEARAATQRAKKA